MKQSPNVQLMILKQLVKNLGRSFNEKVWKKSQKPVGLLFSLPKLCLDLSCATGSFIIERQVNRFLRLFFLALTKVTLLQKSSLTPLLLPKIIKNGYW
jgi:hypothetical protein